MGWSPFMNAGNVELEIRTSDEVVEGTEEIVVVRCDGLIVGRFPVLDGGEETATRRAWDQWTTLGGEEKGYDMEYRKTVSSTLREVVK